MAWFSENQLKKFVVFLYITYLFFIFYGTDMPFRGKIEDVDEIQSSNRVSQLVFSSLFLLSLYPLWRKRRQIVAVMRNEKFLTLFLIWCLLSIFWSGWPLVSFKRLFQIFVSVTVPLAYFVLIPPEGRLRHLFYFLLIHIGLSLVVVLTIPGATHPGSSAWRGFAPSKNHFGQVTLLSAIVFVAGVKDPDWRIRLLSLPGVVLATFLLLGSRSGTALITGMILLFVAALFSFEKIWQRIKIGRIYAVFTLGIVLLLAFAFFAFAPDVLAGLPGIMGKDLTFTGRVYLWEAMLNEVRNHLFLGCGYSGFWVIDNPKLLALYEDFVWLPRQAHMGYLDLLNEVGLIGIALFVTMVIHFFFALRKRSKFYFGHWIIAAVLIINLQETTLFRKNIVSGVLFIVAYLDLFTLQLFRKEI